MRDTTIQDEFDPDNVQRYQIKEEWVFDKESSRLHVRILGIAPMKTIAACGETTRGVPVSIPNIPRFDTAIVPPEISS